MLFRRDVRRNDKRVADSGGHVGHVLARAFEHHLIVNLLARLFVHARLDQRALEQRAGIGQLQILAVVVDVADVGQREDRLAAVAFAPGHRGDGAGRRDGRLRRVADAVLLDARDDRVPVQRGSAPIVRRIGGASGVGGCHLQILRDRRCCP